MARQPKTRQPKTKFDTRHKMKCASCGVETPKYQLIKVGMRVLAFCDPFHLPKR